MASGSTDMSTRQGQITALTTWRASTVMTVMTLFARIRKCHKTHMYCKINKKITFSKTYFLLSNL